jgi:hypothetical protein
MATAKSLFKSQFITFRDVRTGDEIVFHHYKEFTVLKVISIKRKKPVLSSPLSGTGGFAGPVVYFDGLYHEGGKVLPLPHPLACPAKCGCLLVHRKWERHG